MASSRPSNSRPKSSPLPPNSKRLKAYAASAANSRINTTVLAVTIVLLIAKRPRLPIRQASAQTPKSMLDGSASGLLKSRGWS